MAKNIEHVFLLRNGNLYNSREDALAGLEANKNRVGDGELMLARYTNPSGDVVTITGVKHEFDGKSGFTFVDVEGTAADIDALREEINAKLGTGITSANTATAQLEALSGGTFTPGTSSSADTSVEGAKAYTYDLIGTLDYTDTAVDGQYVSEVNEADGVITVTRVELPSSADTAVAKKVVIAVSEDKGQIEVTRGEISSSAETIVLTDNADGGVNFEANIDNATIVQGADKKLKVADSALTQHYGDEKTIHAEVDAVNNTKTFSTLLQLSATTVTETNVKEQFNLVNASGETIGATIKIYKDSSLYRVYLGHVDDRITSTEDPTVIPGTGNTALCFIYYTVNGEYELVTVDVEEFIEENEFASGVTWDSGATKVRGVVDPATEKGRDDNAFLTVGADGFKVDGIKEEIKKNIEDLDATVSGVTSGAHVTLIVEELDGKLVQSGFTFEENDIASQSLLDELSAKTVTNIKSTNESITAESAATTDGTVEFDIITDASKIKMSGFTADVSGFTGITEVTSVSDAVKEVETEFLINEEITSAALNDLNDRIIELSGASLSGVVVNNVVVPVSNNAAQIEIASGDAAGSEGITVETDSTTGTVTLKLNVIDCGTYDN